MAVGPSLRQLDAHQAIHHGGYAGALSRTEEVFELLTDGESEQAAKAVDELLDYWQTRIISHADAEEEGFYAEIAAGKPELSEAIAKLTRDHELMRMMVADIQRMRQEEGLNHEVLRNLQALLAVNEIHSREEERLLFD